MDTLKSHLSQIHSLIFLQLEEKKVLLATFKDHKDQEMAASTKKVKDEKSLLMGNYSLLNSVTSEIRPEHAYWKPQ